MAERITLCAWLTNLGSGSEKVSDAIIAQGLDSIADLAELTVDDVSLLCSTARRPGGQIEQRQHDGERRRLRLRREQAARPAPADGDRGIGAARRRDGRHRGGERAPHLRRANDEQHRAMPRRTARRRGVPYLVTSAAHVC